MYILYSDSLGANIARAAIDNGRRNAKGRGLMLITGHCLEVQNCGLLLPMKVIGCVFFAKGTVRFTLYSEKAWGLETYQVCINTDFKNIT